MNNNNLIQNYTDGLKQYLASLEFTQNTADTDTLESFFPSKEQPSWSVYTGIGKASGKDRGIHAAKLALQDSLIISALKEHRNILVQIIGDLSFIEFHNTISYIQTIADKSVASCGCSLPDMTDEVWVIITIYS